MVELENCFKSFLSIEMDWIEPISGHFCVLESNVKEKGVRKYVLRIILYVM